MCRLIPSELIHEDVLVDVVDSELDKDLAEVCHINDLFIFPSALELSGGFGIGAEDLFVSQELRTNDGKYVFARDVEGGANSPEVMQPSIKIDDRLVLLIQREEVGKLLDLVLGYIMSFERCDAEAKLFGHHLLAETGVMTGEVEITLLTLFLGIFSCRLASARASTVFG